MQSCQGQSIIKSEINSSGCGKGVVIGMSFEVQLQCCKHVCIQYIKIELHMLKSANHAHFELFIEMREIYIVLEGIMRVSVR